MLNCNLFCCCCLTDPSIRYRNRLSSRRSAAYQRGVLAVVDPALHGKVGGLGAVEAVVESGVVAEREGDDKLARFLRHLRHSHAQAGPKTQTE